MSTHRAIMVPTVKAAEAIPQYRFVTYTGGLAAAGAHALGVSQYAAGSGELLAVTAQGTAIVEAGGALAAGDAVSADANSRAVERTDGVMLGRVAPGASALVPGSKVEIILILN